MVPWSWGRGVRVSTDERAVVTTWEETVAPFQEKMGGVPCLQAQGTEQVRFPGRPDTRVPAMRMAGVWVRAGERRGETGDQEEGLGCGPQRSLRLRSSLTLWAATLPQTPSQEGLPSQPCPGTLPVTSPGPPPTARLTCHMQGELVRHIIVFHTSSFHPKKV